MSASRSDPYIDALTGILRNKLGIRDPVVLADVERDLTVVALYRLERNPLSGAYDLDHLCRFHRAIFGDIYPWAGEVRTVAIAKTNLFALPEHIESSAEGIFSALAGEGWLRGLSRDRFVTRLSYHFAEVNALHPFREGNGRTQRAFFAQVAMEAGWYLDWNRMRPEDNVEASIASMRGDCGPLEAMFSDVVTDR